MLDPRSMIDSFEKGKAGLYIPPGSDLINVDKEPALPPNREQRRNMMKQVKRFTRQQARMKRRIGSGAESGS